MVRRYVRKYTNDRNGKRHNPYLSYNKEDLEIAIKLVQEGIMKLTEAAEKYKIPVSTLSRKCRNINCSQEKSGHPTLFSHVEESAFVVHLLLLSEWGFPFDLVDLRVMASKYLNKLGKTIPSLKNNVPGHEWSLNFMERHKDEISKRKAINIATDRAAVTVKMVEAFFSNYTKTIEGIPPENIINYDETNLSDNPGQKSYIFKRGTKYPEIVKNSSKSAISLMFAGTASGVLLPIYVVYKSEHLWDVWTEG